MAALQDRGLAVNRRQLQQARSRVRRRKSGEAPWYDRKQVYLPPQLRELQRLYWRANQRMSRVRSGGSLRGIKPVHFTGVLLDIRELMAEARKSRSLSQSRLRKLRADVRRLARELDRALSQ